MADAKLPDFNSLKDLTSPQDQLLSLSPEEQKEVDDWLMGKTREVPDVVRTVTTDVQQKVNYAMCSVIISNMRRSVNLINYIEKAESIIYTEESLKGTEGIQDKYQDANKVLTSTLDFIRKFMLQNKEAFKPDETKVDEVKTLLSQLPVDRLEAIAQAISEGKI